MMKLTSTLLIFSIMFMMTQHPLMMALILMMITLTNSLLTGMFNMNYWFSFMLFMIMIGGMLVLIIYMTTIASNEMMEQSTKFLPFMIILILAMFMPDSWNIYINNSSEETLKMLELKNNFFLSKFIMSTHLPLIIVTINYLFITLIAIVKITSFKYGSLRQKF